MRLDLYRAETRGHVVTDHAEIPFRLFTHAEQPVIVFQWRLAEKNGTAELQWIPHSPKSHAETPRTGESRSNDRYTG